MAMRLGFHGAKVQLSVRNQELKKKLHLTAMKAGNPSRKTQVNTSP